MLSIAAFVVFKYYDINMFLAIAIAICQQTTFLSYLLESKFFTCSTTDETHALMIAMSIFSALLSVPSMIWNFIMARDNKTRRDYVSFIISIGTFLFGIGFLVFSFLHRLHSMGGKLF